MAQLETASKDINLLVREYLQHAGFLSSLEMFEAECKQKGQLPVESTPDAARAKIAAAHIQNEMMSLVDEGDMTGFFGLWEKHIPSVIREQDPTCLKLEFYLQIYFAVLPLSQSPDAARVSQEEAMNRFKHFLEHKGAALCKTTEFLPYYALPFVPDPQAHPSFNSLFSKTWVPELKARLEQFLSTAITTTTLPRIYYMMKQAGGGRHGGVDSEYLEAIEQQLAECETRELHHIHRINSLNREYHALLGIASELAMSLEDCVRGKMISAKELTDICSRLMELTTRPQEPEGNVESKESIVVPPLLDVQKIHADLKSLTDRNKCVVLQALRWRLTRARQGAERRAVLDAYTSQDILQMDTAALDDLMALCQSGGEVVREYLTRFLNCLASMSKGRAYLLKNEVLVERLSAAMMDEQKDSIARQNMLGTLQKLSLRRQAQSIMIDMDMIDWLVEQLRRHEALSDYSVEYSVALLMNLCLRTAGKQRCARDPQTVLAALADLLEHDNTQVRTYVHGTLYSILALSPIREAAHVFGLEALLTAQLAVSEPTLANQLKFIVQQLNSHEETHIEDGYISEDGQGEEDEEDEGDGEDLMAADAGEEETVTATTPTQAGEHLLQREYLLAGQTPTLGSAPMDAASRPVSSVRLKIPPPPPGDPSPLSRPVTPHARPHTSQRQVPPPSSHSVRESEDPDATHVSSRSGRPSSRQRPSSGRVTTSASASGRPDSRVRPASQRQGVSRPTTSTGPRRGDGAAEGQADDAELMPPPPRPVDHKASEVLASKVGRLVVEPTGKIAPPSSKALEKAGDTNVDEYYAAFSTRVKIPRTPGDH